MRNFFSVIIVAMAMLFVVIFADAEEFASKEQLDTKTYTRVPYEKAENGFLNLAFGWTELPKKIVEVTKETNPIQGLLWGSWQGTVKAISRTANGVADLATFPIGRYEKPKVLPPVK